MNEFLTMFGSSENGEEHLNLCRHVETQLGVEEHCYISSELNLLHAKYGEQCSESKGNKSNDKFNELKNCPKLHEVTENIVFRFSCFLIFFGGI